MSEMYTFDDLNDASYYPYSRPLFAIDLNNESEVFTWLKENKTKIKNENTNRLEKVKFNYLRYRGLQYFNEVYTPRDVLETSKRYTPQLVLPLISDAIDEIVSRLMEYKPNVDVLPVHDESQDKNDAKVAKKFLKSVDYNQKLDNKFQKWLRNSKITGESFLWVRWNPDAGDVIPEAIALQKTENGAKAVPVRMGDVEIVHKTPHWVSYEETTDWDKVNYCFIDEVEYCDALKIDYPDKADKIHEESIELFDYQNMMPREMRGCTIKTYFYHKKTKYLPQGFEAIFTKDVLLKTGPNPYEHGELPIERLIDIHNDEELHGQSMIDKVKGIASQVNNSLNAVIKMIMLAGYAKWFVQAGSVDETSLNNDVSIVKIKNGANAPVLAQANPVGQQQFAFIDSLKNYFFEFTKSNSVVRGEPPAGVTAGVALQYVSESESRRLTTDVANFNLGVRNVYDKILKVCGQFYKPGEKRTMLLLGKDNQWEMTPLDTSALSKSYSVMIQNVSGLSDSKAVMTQQLIDLQTAFPGALPQEQVIEMMGFAQSGKFIDEASIAARAAEDENEYIMDGKGQIEPAEWEDHITHWTIHSTAMQPMGFKTSAPPQVIEAAEAHLMATELMMMDIAAKNPAYMQQLMMLKGFPKLMAVPFGFNAYGSTPPPAPMPGGEMTDQAVAEIPPAQEPAPPSPM